MTIQALYLPAGGLRSAATTKAHIDITIMIKEIAPADE